MPPSSNGRRLGLRLAGVALAAATASLGALALGGNAAARVRASGGVHMNIYFVAAGGGRPTQLTKNPSIGEDRLAYDPSWSPEGKRMLFTEVLCHYCSSDIHVMSSKPARGTAWLRRKIGEGFHPRWSPTGKQIVYVGTSGGIYVMRPDGSHRRLIARGGLADDGPSWSPDGRRVVFTRQETATKWRLYVVDANGTGLKPLRSGPRAAVNPSWSPSGGRIAFAQQQRSGRWQIVSMRLDGGGRTRISSGRASDSFPVWSPNGHRLAFVRQQGNANAVFTMEASGRNVRRVSPRSMNAVEPAWSPGGKFVAFAADVKD
jgi:Tol biopolymer transport system component